MRCKCGDFGRYVRFKNGKEDELTCGKRGCKKEPGPMTPAKNEPMPQTPEYWMKRASMDLELIMEMKEEISKLKQKVDKLRKKLGWESE